MENAYFHVGNPLNANFGRLRTTLPSRFLLLRPRVLYIIIYIKSENIKKKKYK